MKLLLGIIWIFVFSSCTQQRLALRFADTAASWKADDYFDLTSSQKDTVKKVFNIVLRKSYKHTELGIPQLFERSDVVLSQVDERKKINCNEIENIRIASGKIFPQIVKLSASDVQNLIQTLDKKQIQYFIKQIAEKIEDDEKQLKKMADREERRIKRHLENSRIFLGSLSTKQEASIRSHLKENPFPYEEQLINNKLNYEKLKTTNANPEDFQKFFLDYFENWRKYHSVMYLKLSDEHKLKNERFYQNLICEASIKQLNHLRQKLNDVKNDFEEFFIQNEEFKSQN